MPLRATLRRHLLPRRHSALLMTILVAFAVRPLIGEAGAAPIVFSIAIVVLLFVALYTVQVDELTGDREQLVADRRRRGLVGLGIAVVAIGERLATLFIPSPGLFLVGSLSWLGFFSFVTWSLLRSLLRHKEVTGETISLSISIYLLLGLCWGILYSVIFELHPDAFNIAGVTVAGADPVQLQQHLFPIFIYFSLTTLSTIGFGDITPMTLPARYAAVAEGITGQLYLAVLVARLVGLQMARSADPERRK